MIRPQQQGSEPGQTSGIRPAPSRTPLANNAPPTSFKTNVNRAKTKRWVEAKSYTYDGDDWGDVDDYDEYRGYDDLAPSIKPTGLRQAGQSASQTPPNYGPRQHSYESDAGDGASQPRDNIENQAPMQQQRSATNPVYNTSNEGRLKSLNAEEERRAFSANRPQHGTFPTDQRPSQPTQSQQDQKPAKGSTWPVQNVYSQQQPNQPIHNPSLNEQSRSSMDGRTRTFSQDHQAAENNRGVSYSDQPRGDANGSRTQSMSSNVSSADVHSRRDFSPSALPPPLQMRASPTPAYHPPRKSSLSQQAPPQGSYFGQGPVVQSTAEAPQLSSIDIVRERAGSNGGKPLPFIRPADIYRRMQEEKEKERQSQDSSRPSIDAINSGQTSFAQESLESDDSKRGLRSEKSLDDSEETDSARRPKPNLVTVTERRSEYGIDESVSLDSRDVAARQSYESDKKPRIAEGPTKDRNLGSPVLPDVARMSGFGESFLGSIVPSQQESPPTSPLPSQPEPKSTQQPTSVTQNAAPLQHQPSFGFRSIVHQAFDTPEDHIPQTPSSGAGSGVARTNSESTSGVSPIMSRAPSNADGDVKANQAEAREKNFPMIAEEPNENASRPNSSDSLGTPKQLARKTSPSQSTPSDQAESVPTSFIPGHRRDTSTPSPNNSPARTPALEINRQLRQPQEVELAMATPTDLDPNYMSRQADVNAGALALLNLESPFSVPARGPHNPILEARMGKKAESPITPVVNNLSSRNGSPTKSRVRDLAGRFESDNNNRQGSDQSLSSRNSFSGRRPDDLAPPRPLTDRMESFRPHLPGGWDSYASTAPIEGHSIKEDERQSASVSTENFVGQEMRGAIIQAGLSSQGEDIELTPTTVKRTLSKKDPNELSNDPFSAVVAAGSALAGAIATAVGIEHEQSATPNSEDSTEERESYRSPRGRSASFRDTTYHPEASRSFIPPPIEDDDSSAAPTPLPKDFPPPSGNPMSSEYFAPVAPLKQRPRSVINANEALNMPTRPLILPSLSTDTSPQDYESDRLRKQIVRELSPQIIQSRDDGGNNSVDATDDSKVSTPSGPRTQAHESMVIPREYESYWNGSNSEDDSSRRTSQQNFGTVQAPKGRHLSGEAASEETELGENLPLRHDSDKVQQSVLAHRFSWEATPEEMNSPQDPFPPRMVSGRSSPQPGSGEKLPIRPSLGDSSQNAKGLDNRSPSVQLDDYSQKEGDPPQPFVSDKDIHETPRSILAAEVHERSSDLIGTGKGSGDQIFTQGEEATIAAVYSPTSSTLLKYGTTDNQLVSPLLPREQLDISALTEKSKHIRDKSQIPLPPSATGQQKIPAFREILALKSPAERIRVCNETREQFASMNTGLSHWISSTVHDYPEHSHLITSSGVVPIGDMGHKSSPSRNGLSTFGVVGQKSGQQPYYQQYLNASTQPTSSSSPAGVQSSPGGSSLGYSPSSAGVGKLSGQPVQSKGKDLLHSAGRFGGKANVTAKGLFSKGKNKFRGSGAVDKALPTIPPSPNLESSNREMQQPQSQPQPEFEAQHVPFVSESQSRPLSLLNASQDQLSSSTGLSRPLSLVNPLHARAEPAEIDKSETEAAQSEPMKAEDSHLSGYDPSLEDSAGNATPPEAPTWLPQNTSFEPPRTSTSPEVSPTTADSIPDLVQQEPSIPPGQSIPKRLSSPRSTASDNNTPTQADFIGDDKNLPQPPDVLHSLQMASSSSGSSQMENVKVTNWPAVENRTLQKEQSRARSNTQDHSNAAGSSFQSSVIPRTSEDSEGTFHTADAGTDSVMDHKQPPNDLTPTNLSSTQAPTPSSPQEVPQGITQPASSGQLEDLVQASSRPFSFISFGQSKPLQLSDGSSFRGPSIDSTADQMYQKPPLSPVSPQRSVFSHQSQRTPVHYDVNHDFLPHEASATPRRDRPRSFSRPFHDPNIRQHPAFRQDRDKEIEVSSPSVHYYPPRDKETSVTEPPTQHYPAQIRREEAKLPRQQTIEYQLEGVGPPPIENRNGKPRSRRGSWNSGFFGHFNSPQKGEVPPIPSNMQRQDTDSSTASPIAKEKRTKRGSIFRSMTGHGGNETGRIKENTSASSSRSRTDSQHMNFPQEQKSQPGTPGANNNPRNKLNRSSTSGISDSNSGRKKRFSGLGTLFGRSNPNKSASTNSQTNMPLQPSHTQQQSRQNSAMGQLQPSSQYDERLPPNSQSTAYQATRQAYEPPPDYTQPGVRGYYSPEAKGHRPAQNYTGGDYQSSQQQYMQPGTRTSEMPAQYQDPYPHSRGLPHSRNPHDMMRDDTDYLRGPPEALQQQAQQLYSDRRSSREPVSGQFNNDDYLGDADGPRNQRYRNEDSPRHVSQYSPSRTEGQQVQSHPLNFNPAGPSSDGRRQSPPPPPPPPKDNYLQPRSNHPNSLHQRSSSHSPNPHSRSPAFNQRQSLPPLRTNMTHSPHNSASIKTVTPEEMRRARREEIEKTGMETTSPARSAGAGGSGWERRLGQASKKEEEGRVVAKPREEEKIVMTSTSYPGQEWQPDFTSWEGE